MRTTERILNSNKSTQIKIRDEIMKKEETRTLGLSRTMSVTKRKQNNGAVGVAATLQLKLCHFFEGVKFKQVLKVAHELQYNANTT